MDSLTHALTAAVLAYALGLPQLLPFMVLGAVIIDADAFFSRVSDSDPRLYLFTHGGIAHSIGGAVVMAVLAWAGITLASLAGAIPAALLAPAGTVAFAAVLGGTFLHIGLDWLACPGIPLCVPFSDTKYTAGILPGPSILLAAVSIFILIWMGLGVIDLPTMILPYVAIICAFLAVRFAAFCGVRVVFRADLSGIRRAVPMVSPFRWLLIGETPETWTVREYRALLGTPEPTVFLKYRNTTAAAVAPYLVDPAVRRVRYHSYITTVTQEGAGLVVVDPLRKAGLIFYPPYFTEVRIPL
ncbi:metal-dependent hydrolase [Methanosphaerula palustris]|uniref:Membrane-bound metal-dependent hydrolase n=1 Tax=Methanosphaerula palustris (strain ATCC BAA-1556 / DSM 19958 / E1-9c) TaxID=521011 RepID=B8GES5_METPE|nr:metal-dependent hydrolase [Methanosphaerula palustris]ACL17776.1 membrane-bound metal-dependent hydrolase [Methanosphaerula palustris E1-9c]